MASKSLRILEIYNCFKNYPTFTYRELYDFYCLKEPQLKQSTYRWRVYELKKANVIKPIKRGVYQLMDKNNTMYLPSNMSYHDDYLVLTADIIDSTKNKVTQEFFKNKVVKLNDYNRQINSIILPFASSRGDEFQAIAYISPELPTIIRNMRYIFYPIKIRIGIGIGPIESKSLLNSDNSPSDSWDMNGQVFLNARSALEKLKNKKNYCVSLHSSKDELNKTFNLVYRLIDAIVNDWSDKQWEAIQLYDKVKSYESGAEKLGIRKSSFHQRCSAAKWDIIKESETELAHILTQHYL
ncbi:SatD family (SatD) [Anaerovirgula multivorans]|uniref:SatD family (SatD) n=1 Tax=Anaerovirgula multivorans TaxID=312168 RepID=A0A239K2D4_9FIRM|nr:SatD family protein [Anaerovirgula multivorans]SNT12150.1 SatD family (SatD) [Anaerovirgula multivorans]